MSPPPARRPWGCLIVIALFVGGLILVPLMASAFDGSPRDWLDDHYEHVSGDDPDEETIVYRSDDDAAATARDIDEGTDADERRQDGQTHYLRYDSEWMVVVKPEGGGARIELLEFDRGYRSYGPSVFFWSSHYGTGGGGLFRGGGSGAGK